MAKFNETSQEASLCVPFQKYNKGSWLINNNNNKMADFLFCFKKTSETTSPNSMKIDFAFLSDFCQARLLRAQLSCHNGCSVLVRPSVQIFLSRP